MGKFLVSMVKPILSQILVTLGLSVITYKGVDLLVNQLSGTLNSQLSSMPIALIQLLGLSGFDVALSVVFSAFVVKMTMQSTTGLKKK